MKIGIIPHIRLGKPLDLAKKIIGRFDSKNVFLPPDAAEKLGGNGVPIEKMDVDSLITIGGDGTVLYTLQKLSDTPILGINMGRRGFLAEVNPDESMEAVEKLKEGKLKISEKKKLTVEISGEKLADALNEGVIRSQEPSRTLSFRVLVDGEEAERTEGDGLIVSTPTGSTAYALAAGGSIVDPRVDANIAVPLSTHRPKGMPLIYPMSSIFEVELTKSNGKADITVDGQVTQEARKGEIITFRESSEVAKFYIWKRKFYEKLREKL